MRVYIIGVLMGLLAAIAIDYFVFDGRYYTIIGHELGREIKSVLPR